MSETFVTSDDHFFHTRINALSGRPFTSMEEMHENLIGNWNRVVVNPESIVKILGDFSIDGSWKEALELLPQLNGRKHLITGNHDRCWPGKSDGAKFQRFYFEAGFESVEAFGRLKLPPTRRDAPGRKVLLSHFPYDADHTTDTRHSQFRLRDEGVPLLHGHVHELYSVRRSAKGTICVNVGVDAPWTNFTPVSVTQIATLIDEVEAGTREED